jgi:hypothetical protein
MPIKEADNQGKWTYYQIADARKSIQSYYADQQSQQGTRLVGFVIGLFTLLQLTQAYKNSALRNVFPSFNNAFQTHYSVLFDLWKTVFLFIGVSIIMYFILRTVFRYSLYGKMACNVMTISDEAVLKHQKEEEYNELLAFNVEISESVYDKGNVFGISASWFLTLHNKKHPSKERNGEALCAVIAIIITLLLLLFLW